MCPHCNSSTLIVSTSTLLWIIVATIIVTCLVSWFFFHHLCFKRNTYPKFCQRLEQCVETIGYWLQRLWYAILFIGSTIYLVFHFEECRNLTFTPQFNGFNVIFVFWLILLILPLFEKFEGFGVNLKLKQQNKISTDAATRAMDSNDIMSAEQLDQLHREGGSHE